MQSLYNSQGEANYYAVACPRCGAPARQDVKPGEFAYCRGRDADTEVGPVVHQERRDAWAQAAQSENRGNA